MHISSVRNGPGSIGISRVLFGALVGLSFAASFLVYRPDRGAPFDFLDFSEFLPLLTRSHSFGQRLHELSAYYMNDQGRANIVAFILLAAKWTIWGDHPAVWQWLRFGTMWLVMMLTYLLLRRMRLSRMAALVGASVFLFAPSAVEGWIRLTMAEPLGTVLVLLACLLAISETERLTERRVGICFATLCLAVVLLKEMMVVALILPLGLAAVRFGGTSSMNRGRRLRTLLIGGACGVVTGMVPVVIVALRAKPDAYVADFGSRLRPAGDILAQWTLGLLPFGVGSAIPGKFAGIALLAYLTVVAAGWTVRLNGRNDRSRADWMLLTIALLFPLAGAVEYIPWPSYNIFYAIPFLLGGCLLVAVALDAIRSRARPIAFVAIGVWIIFLFFDGAEAWGKSERMARRQLLNRSLVERVAGLSPFVDSVFLATDQRVPAAWQGVGPTLQRYGEAVGNRMPVIVNVPCATARARVPAARRAGVFYSSLCPYAVTPDPMVERFRKLEPSLRFVVDSLRVDVIPPLRPR